MIELKPCTHRKKVLSSCIEVKKSCPLDIDLGGLHIVFARQCADCKYRKQPAPSEAAQAEPKNIEN